MFHETVAYALNVLNGPGVKKTADKTNKQKITNREKTKWCAHCIATYFHTKF